MSTRGRLSALLLALLLAPGEGTYAQECPKPDPAQQKIEEKYAGAAKLGTQVVGRCAAVKTPFGCANQVDDGRIVGSVCVD